MKQITTIAEFEQQLEENNSFFLLKHSTTCPISAAAFDEYSAFLQEPSGNAEGIYLAVQQSRELSSHIAAVTGIRHESPQVIFFKEGKPEWNESHWKITKETLRGIQ